MKKAFLLAAIVLLLSSHGWAGESVTIVYQNDLHGWLFPSSTRVGMGKISRILTPIFSKEPSSFYAVSGDLFTGPDLPDNMKGVSELSIWNRFREELASKGFGPRILISAGNHEFDYGVPDPEDFSSGLLCANLLDTGGSPYYLPYRVIETDEGLSVGFMGLLLEGNGYVLNVVSKEGLEIIPMLTAAKRFVPEMGETDLTVLMIHDDIENIVELAQELPPELGVDMILTGHNHLVFERPLIKNGIYIFQAGDMNTCYGRADLEIEEGKIISLRNKITPLKPSPLEHAMMRVKEKVDQRNGKTLAVVKHSLMGTNLRNGENSLGDFVTDAFREATGSDVAMTNSGSLRMDCPVYGDDPFELKEGHIKSITPFRNHLVVGKVTGRQIMSILEGEAVHFHNQVSGLSYKMDLRKPQGKRIVEALIGDEPISLNRTYTLTHNSYCTRKENMEEYLHLEPGSIEWKNTHIMDYQALMQYASRLGVIDYPPNGEDRIVVIE